MSETVDLKPGFADPVTSAQEVFRQILEALSRPGRIGRLSSDLDATHPLDPATASICLALVDVDTPLWIAPELRSPGAEAFLKFHCGCPITQNPADAQFAIVPGDRLPELGTFNQGDPAYPETSTTAIVQVARLDEKPTDASEQILTLTGPGIEAEHVFSVSGLRTFTEEWRDNCALFPCGVDLVLTAGDKVVGLPRTVVITQTA